MRCHGLILAGMVVAWAATGAFAQDRVDATVVSVSGRSVYVDAGRTQGVAVDARVVFVLRSGVRVDATIADVSSSSARAQLPALAIPPAIGDRAEIEVVPPEEPEQAPEGPAPRPVPVHPPWAREEEERAPDQPLLAPAFSTSPKDRPTSIRGRAFLSFTQTKDFENDADYSYGRVGLRLDITNPFHEGGRVRLEADSDLRIIDTFGENGTDAEFRARRLSYAWGIDQYAPVRAEVGRFYSEYLPEIGLVDGVEGALRLQNGWNLGAGVGLYPSNTQDEHWGDDYGFHVFADYRSDSADGWLQGTAGLQQTWHKGAADRTLLIGRVNARPTEKLTVFGSILVDLYGSDDDIKDEFGSVTQLVLQSTYRFDDRTGVNASFTRTTWPELKRQEYVFLPEELIRDGHIDRLSGSVWHRITDEVRLTARGHAWRDQSREGFGGELSADWSMPRAHNASLYGSVYYEDSAYTDGVGVRLQGRRDVGPVQVFAGYDVFAYTTESALSGTDDHLRHTVRGDVTWSTGPWSWDLEMAYTFGDREDALAVSAYIQYRF